MSYTKQTWDTTSYVNPTRMNHIEQGIYDAVKYVERWTGDLTSGISCTVPTLANSSELLISGFIGSDSGGNRFFVSFPIVFNNEYGYNPPSLIDANGNIYRMTMYYNKNDNSFKMSAQSTIHVTKICTR